MCEAKPVQATNPTDLSATLASLPQDVAGLQQMVLELLAAVAELTRKNAQLTHQLHLHLAYRYGPRSERLSPDQLLLFDTDEVGDGAVPTVPAPEDTASADESRPASGTPSRRNGRKRLPAELPRVRREFGLEEAERICPICKKPMVKVGEDVSEILEYRPASFFVIQEILAKYACKTHPDGVLTAVKPVGPIAKGLPGPGLLADVILKKYGDHLPLYRQEQIYARHGVALSRKTLCDWVAAAAELAKPVYLAMKADVRSGCKVHTDDTPVPVLDATRDRTRTARLWVYVGDVEHPQTVYEYTPDRKQEHPAEFLGGFAGYLQADAYGGYDGIYAGEAVIEVACMAHARRKFFEARESDRLRAHAALAWIRRLYDVEDVVRGLPPVERKRIRVEKARPVLDAFKAWLDAEKPQVLPQSPIGKAIGYALNQWAALCRYLDDGILEIDNNLAERQLRPVAVGRKNWMFAGSDEGGRRAATLYSLIQTAKAHGVEPFGYLRDIFERLPTHPAERMAELMPAAWKKAREPAAAPG